MNYTAISEPNEMLVINALRGSLHGLLDTYPTTAEEDEEILIEIAAQQSAAGTRDARSSNGDDPDSFADDESTESESTSSQTDQNSGYGPIMKAAVQLRLREKNILHGALAFLEAHETAVKNNSVPFQLELKAQERVEADLRAEIRRQFMEDIKARALIRPELAVVEVDMGTNNPKANLTLHEGRDLMETVQLFCKEHGVKPDYYDRLAKALKAKVSNPPPLTLMMGAIVETGERKILAVPEGANSTIEVGIFCARYDSAKNPLDSEWCQSLMKRVKARMEDTPFRRRILLVVPIDAPDSRKLQLVLHEGEQHDLIQFVSDFFELYHMPAGSVEMMANEVHKRLPPVVTQIPVGLNPRRQVTARFAMNDNITAVVEAFANFYELEDSMKIAIMKRARYNMAPGTFMV